MRNVTLYAYNPSTGLVGNVVLRMAGRCPGFKAVPQISWGDHDSLVCHIGPSCDRVDCVLCKRHEPKRQHGRTGDRAGDDIKFGSGPVGTDIVSFDDIAIQLKTCEDILRRLRKSVVRLPPRPECFGHADKYTIPHCTNCGHYVRCSDTAFAWKKPTERRTGSSLPPTGFYVWNP